MTQTPEQKAALDAALASRPSDEDLRRIAASVPPLQRDEDHSFVSADDTDVETDPKLVQPVGAAARAQQAAAKPVTVTVRRDDHGGEDRKGSTYERSAVVTEVDLERMTDEQIKDSGLLEKGISRVPPSRLQHGSRPRQPGQYAPAAGAGSWPANESAMPAVMPTDPPVEDHEDRNTGSNGFADVSGFKPTEDGTLVRNGVEIAGKDVAEAASLYLRLRQQFPSFTRDQLSDEFEVQWLSGRVGAAQSQRAGDEASANGLTAVGDTRTEEPNLGELRREADEAEPQAGTPAPADAPEAGLPSANEPATVAVDAAKAGVTETKADDAAMQEAKDLEGKTTGANAPPSKPADGTEARP